MCACVMLPGLLSMLRTAALESPSGSGSQSWMLMGTAASAGERSDAGARYRLIVQPQATCSRVHSNRNTPTSLWCVASSQLNSLSNGP
jgi:hypothetical protein